MKICDAGHCSLRVWPLFCEETEDTDLTSELSATRRFV
jgi:hypothetical protein